MGVEVKRNLAIKLELSHFIIRRLFFYNMDTLESTCIATNTEVRMLHSETLGLCEKLGEKERPLLTHEIIAWLLLGQGSRWGVQHSGRSWNCQLGDLHSSLWLCHVCAFVCKTCCLFQFMTKLAHKIIIWMRCIHTPAVV